MLVWALSTLHAAATSMNMALLLKGPWASQLGWNASLSMCSEWTGVTCDGSDVVKL